MFADGRRVDGKAQHCAQIVVLLVQEKVRWGLVLTERDLEAYRECQQFLDEQG